MEKLHFSDCTLTLLDRRFGLRRELSNPTLDRWLQSTSPLTELEKSKLRELQEMLLLNAEGWN